MLGLPSNSDNFSSEEGEKSGEQGEKATSNKLGDPKVFLPLIYMQKNDCWNLSVPQL